MKRQRRAFELIEIAIVILIIAILVAIAVPNFIRAREEARARNCISNLRMIEVEKESWCLKTGCKDGAVPPSVEELFKGKEIPICSSEGHYDTGVIGEKATCSLGMGPAVPHVQ